MVSEKAGALKQGPRPGRLLVGYLRGAPLLAGRTYEQKKEAGCVIEIGGKSGPGPTP